MRASASRNRTRRVWRHPAIAVGLAALALLLFLWPFLREPRPALGRAWVELFVAWTLAVVVLWAMARHQGPGAAEPPRGEGDG